MQNFNIAYAPLYINPLWYESDRILGLSVTINGSSILFNNVYFPVTCHAKFEEYIMCLGILSSILESYEEDQVRMHTGGL